jgi:hypothetical protein
MNLGEFIIKIGTQGDTKKLDETIKKLTEAEKKTRRQIKVLQDLSKATNDQEKALIRKNAAQQDELDNLKAVKSEQDSLNSSMQKSIGTALKMVGAIGATVTMLDRLGNSLLKSNQMYITFERQSGISISRLNRMAGIAQLSGMGLSPEQVAGDIQSLQHKIFRFERFGEGARTFGMLGINPRGMDSDKLILSLRGSLKKYSGRVKSEILQELGLSQEWLNVLELSDEQFKDYLKTSSQLQLTEKERKQLAKYTAKQQMNNMRWELAKQRLLLTIMPAVQKIMEATSKIALQVANVLEKNPKWLYVLRDILLLLAGNAVIKSLTAFAGLLSGGAIGKAIAGLGGLFGAGKALTRVAGRKGLRTALGMAGKRLIGGAAGFLGGPVVGAIFTIASACLLIKDIKDLIMDWLHIKREEEEELTPDPDEGGARYQYHNVKSNLTNNFYNNPQPTEQAIRELANMHNLILAEQYR